MLLTRRNRGGLRDEEEEEEENDRRVHRKSSDSELSLTSQPTVKASSSVELEEDFSDIRYEHY
jgi:hypothetical protein